MIEGEIEQPNPYKELRKELVLLYKQISKTFNKIDFILKRFQEETE